MTVFSVDDDVTAFFTETFRNSDRLQQGRIQNGNDIWVVDSAVEVNGLGAYSSERRYWRPHSFWAKFRKRLYVFSFGDGCPSQKLTGGPCSLSASTVPSDF
jgi:hypothetical protein